MTAWLGLFICWTVLAALDLALAIAFWPHVSAGMFVTVAIFAAAYAMQALHSGLVNRRFRRAEALAKRHLVAMERCAERTNRLGYDANREQLEAAVNEMRRIAKQ